MTRRDGALTVAGRDGTLGTKADFYVSPAGEAIEGKYESWIGRNQREEQAGVRGGAPRLFDCLLGTDCRVGFASSQ